MFARHLRSILNCLVIATALVIPATGAARTWTQSSTGKTIEADFVRLESDQITLKTSNGKEYTFPLDTLVDEDQAFAKDAMKEIAEKEADAEVLREKKARQGRLENYHLLDLSYVHMCCDASHRAIEKAAKKSGLDHEINRRTRKITFYAKPKEGSSSEQEDPAAFANAVKALLDAGYYGDESSNFSGIEVLEIEGGDSEVEEGKFTEINICCNKCVKAVKDAVSEVDGVESVTAEKESREFLVTGKFKPADVIKALRTEGLNAQLP